MCTMYTTAQSVGDEGTKGISLIDMQAVEVKKDQEGQKIVRKGETGKFQRWNNAAHEKTATNEGEKVSDMREIIVDGF